jgi:hypothetical protein
LLIGLELRAIAGPFEDWPFTSAPMFARYQLEEDAIYRLVFHVEKANGEDEIIDAARALGIGELSIKRLFFGSYYGSTDPSYPLGHKPHDTSEAFTRRLSDFSARVVRVYSRNLNQKPKAFRIELAEYRAGRLQYTRVVSRYDAKLQTLTRPRVE